LACCLQIDEDPEPIPDPAHHFDADPDFYLIQMVIRMRIQTTKMMRVHVDPDLQN
jgi:hypothetical protein